MFPYLYGSAYNRAWFTLFGVVIKEVQFSFFQFFTWRSPFYSFFHTISVILSSLNRLLLGRSLKYSFAFTGEDRIIESFIKKNVSEIGYYVEVGSNHPKFLSNTYSLYRKGWKGICIDANPKFKRLHQKIRPRDIAITALISNKEGESVFYLVQNDVLSSIDKKVVAQYQTEGLKVNEINLPTITLAKLLKENNVPKEFDLLIIDAEEHDREVLYGMDWKLFQPQWVIIEEENWEIGNSDGVSLLHYMDQIGYRLEGWILKNLYFKKIPLIIS
ncbi:FkbM family methyltransferase [Cognataquiflexum aquatile]|uniref:FkbM family methyltransferase n=1 Tax=Cognataquiflexum aquatile TaxID=2249427 RepID=UPI0013002031|nr:FkbM family methyltransferase [Cognataquiflexum aquatile]